MKQFIILAMTVMLFGACSKSNPVKWNNLYSQIDTIVSNGVPIIVSAVQIGDGVTITAIEQVPQPNALNSGIYLGITLDYSGQDVPYGATMGPMPILIESDSTYATIHAMLTYQVTKMWIQQ